MGAISSQPRPISKRPTTVQVVPISNSQNKTNQQTFTVNKTCCNEENEDISYLLTILHDSFTKASDFKFHLFKDNTNGLTTIFERYLEEVRALFNCVDLLHTHSHHATSLTHGRYFAHIIMTTNSERTAAGMKRLVAFSFPSSTTFRVH